MDPTMNEMLNELDRLLDPTINVVNTVRQLVTEVLNDPDSWISTKAARKLASIAEYHVPRLQDAVEQR